MNPAAHKHWSCQAWLNTQTPTPVYWLSETVTSWRVNSLCHFTHSNFIEKLTIHLPKLITVQANILQSETIHNAWVSSKTRFPGLSSSPCILKCVNAWMTDAWHLCIPMTSRRKMICAKCQVRGIDLIRFDIIQISLKFDIKMVFWCISSQIWFWCIYWNSLKFGKFDINLYFDVFKLK